MRPLLAVFVSVLLTFPVTAQVAPPVARAPAAAPASAKLAPELEARIRELPALLNGGGDYEQTFSPAFRALLTKEVLAQSNQSLAAIGGKAIGIDSIMPVGPWGASVKIGYERGVAAVQLTVDPTPPHQINGMRLTGMAGREASIDAVVATLAGLPGTTGFALARLDAGGPVMLTARAPDTRFAIGSEFKLIILAELVRAVAAGERKWEDMVTLDGTPLPGGGYTRMPKGTTVPLYELAERMISVSDNSATDILIATLGRERIEAMLPVTGVRDPRGMRPFLTTLEAFKLKSAFGARWATLDEAGRRALLAGEVAAMPVLAINGAMFAAGKPLQIDSIEWFATPADMVRVMDWLRRNTESGPAARARTILSKNSGVGPDAAGHWQYLGYKGGSEPGVIAMTFLLQGKDGRWHALSASWNDTAASVDDVRFGGLMARAVELAAPK